MGPIWYYIPLVPFSPLLLIVSLLGQLGHGGYISLSHPMRVPSLRDITHISAGGMHSGCITASKECYMWGDNSQGQLGINSRDRTTVDQPTLVRCAETQEPLRALKISCGGMHSGAVDLNGDVYCWGKSDSGQTGSRTWYLGLSTNIYGPKKVDCLSNAIDIRCGGFYTLVLDQYGQVFAMGKEDFGCLGLGLDEPTLDIRKEGPMLVHKLEETPIKQICCGGWHSFFLSDEGRLYTAGKGEYGRTGLGQESSKLSPTLVTKTAEGQEVKDIVQVAAGGAHSIWFDKNNHVFTVGRLENGRCGIGPTPSGRSTMAMDVTSKFPIQGFTVLEVSCGGSHSLVLIEAAEPLDDQFLVSAASPAFGKLMSSK